ncbi:BPSS1780 family membrane protein [Coralloluteibacterium thermophilus]|uniref:BPSS1780 family membrane protein n=1 Tax=Coralloluteibacterium thermophilum TaxID=2707049 RepID=A0ABV9NMJ0_9GAMM
MSHRKVGAGRGAGWIVEGFDVVRQNFGSFAGIAVVFGAIGALPLLNLVVGMLNHVFYAGMVSATRDQVEGRPAQIGQVFDGFSRPGAFLRLLPIVVVNVVVSLVLLVVFLGLVGVQPLMSIMAGNEPSQAETMALLAGVLKAMVVAIPVGLLLWWTLFLATPLAMLDESLSGWTAIRRAFSAMWANIGALIVNLLCWIVIGLVLTIAAGIVGVLGGLLGAGLGLVVQIVVNAVMLAVVMILVGPSMYRAASEIFELDPQAPTAASSGPDETTAAF